MAKTENFFLGDAEKVTEELSQYLDSTKLEATQKATILDFAQRISVLARVRGIKTGVNTLYGE